MALSAEEKKKFLRSLEEDEEFRYAVAGMLGYREILDRITSIEERIVKLEERVARLEEEIITTRRVLMIIAHRFGVISEVSFREGMRYVVEEVLGTAKVSRLVLRDDEGIVYGHPSEVEVDVLVRDKEHILIEVKSRASKGDVAELSRIGRLYELKEGVKPRLLIIGGFVDEKALDLARNLKVEVRGVEDI
ncbi:MAG: hypothetical protein C0200_04720 [Thermoproteota archaeon]|nr:MAG: hypothetical protein C0200_04720 [Candidatus Korarchaeota archaeon]